VTVSGQYDSSAGQNRMNYEICLSAYKVYETLYADKGFLKADIRTLSVSNYLCG
jgi:hypothetical protein